MFPPYLWVCLEVDPSSTQSQQSVVEVEHPVVVARVADDVRDAEGERVGLVVPLEVVIPENHSQITHGPLQSSPVGTPEIIKQCNQILTMLHLCVELLAADYKLSDK